MEEREEGEMKEDIEDGEIEDDNSPFGFGDLVYNPIERPNVTSCRAATGGTLASSDDDFTSEDSDSDAPRPAKRRKNHEVAPPRRPADSVGCASGRSFTFGNGVKKRNSIWSNVLQEQELMQEIGSVGLKRRLDTSERSVETYDYKMALRQCDEKTSHSEEEEEEGETSRKKRLDRKRPLNERLKDKRLKTFERKLENFDVNPEWTDEELGIVIANALFESKPQIIVRVVQVLGRLAALELYRETQLVEENGGMLVLNESRRRTSGGVFLTLLKKVPQVGPKELEIIFPSEKAQQWGRRKRVPRIRKRHDSKPQAEDEEALHLGGLFTNSPEGTKCPGSTPVATPQNSSEEEGVDKELTRGFVIDLPKLPMFQLPTLANLAQLDPRAANFTVKDEMEAMEEIF